MGRGPGKVPLNKGNVCYTDLSLSSPWKRVSCDSRVIHLFLIERGKPTPLQMEILSINVNLPYKRRTSTLLSQLLLCLLFLKVIRSNHSLCQRGIFWSGVFGLLQ